MKLAIMQPYLFPYIGYFQLMNAADEFVVYDNIEFTKKGWINRNRILINGKDDYISFPLKKDSDFLNISDRYLADSWATDQQKILNKIREAYRKAPFFDSVFPLIKDILSFTELNLFRFIINSLEIIKHYFNIETPLIISSTVAIDHSLKAEDKVIEICKAMGATTYINPIGGVALYRKDRFDKEGIQLKFLKTSDFSYQQFNNLFIPFLSIIDVMMFNSREQISYFLTNHYTLL